MWTVSTTSPTLQGHLKQFTASLNGIDDDHYVQCHRKQTKESAYDTPALAELLRQGGVPMHRTASAVTRPYNEVQQFADMSEGTRLPLVSRSIGWSSPVALAA